MKETLWNSKKSIILTKFCILALMVISVIMMFCGRYLISRFLSMTGGAKINISNEFSFYIITFISYILGTIALLTLFCMLKFIVNLENDLVFVPQNIKWLRFISYGCLSAGSLLIITTVIYHKLYIVLSLAALFMMLIVRVIKNAFEQAVKTKEELDLTI
nr:DUF2975 domain-containing protein [uncultured Catonella sp.]